MKELFRSVLQTLAAAAVFVIVAAELVDVMAYVDYRPSPEATVPYDLIVSRIIRYEPERRFGESSVCWQLRGGKHEFLERHRDMVLVRYSPPVAEDFFGVSFRAVTWPEDYGAKPCRSGDLMLVPIIRYETETCAFEITKGLRMPGPCPFRL